MTDPDSTDPADDLARRLRERLDAATARPPAQPAPAARLADGHRALRRRRARSAAVGVAAAVVLVTGAGVAWTATGDGRADRDADVAREVPASSDPCPVLTGATVPGALLDPDAKPTRRITSDGPRLPVEYDDGHDLRVLPGVRVLQHLEGVGDDATSGWDAVEVEGSNGRFFGLLGHHGRSGGFWATPYYRVTPERDSLQQWLTHHVEVGGSRQLLRAARHGTDVVPRDDVELLGSRAITLPGLGRTPVTAAHVRQGEDECYVLVEPSNVTGEAAVQSVVPPEYAGRDLDAFVATARAMYGGRS